MSVRECPTAKSGAIADISGAVISFLTESRTVVLLTVCAKLLGAQGIGSGARSVTLVAVKRPAFESLDAVRVVTERETRPDSAGNRQAQAIVEIRADMPCEIRVSVAGGPPVTAFRGECHAAQSRHLVAVPLTHAHGGAIIYEVTGTLDGVPHRWVAESEASAGR